MGSRSPGSSHQAAPLPQALLEQLERRFQIVVAPEGQQPFPVDAMVVEDDSWCVVGSPPQYTPFMEHPIRLMHSLYEARPLAPGTVTIRDGHPPRLLAVVLDLDRQPIWDPAWTSKALQRVLAIAGEQRYRSLGMPLLGAHHGSMPESLALSLLCRALRREPPASLEVLWLIQDRSLTNQRDHGTCAR